MNESCPCLKLLKILNHKFFNFSSAYAKICLTYGAPLHRSLIMFLPVLRVVCWDVKCHHQVILC